MKRNRTRAARRIAERTAQNATARQVEPQEAEPVRKNARYISQLDLLLSRGNISQRQYEAGDRLYRDWRTSGSEPRLVPSYDREIGLGGEGYQEYQIEARLRFEEAIQALGKRCRDVVIHVCLMDGKIVEYPLSAADTMDRLRDGLNDLSIWHDTHRRKKRLDEPRSEIVFHDRVRETRP